MHNSTSYGLLYQDLYRKSPASLTYNDLFLIGFVKAYGDVGVSDSLTVLSELILSNGTSIKFPNDTLLNKIYLYLHDRSVIQVENDRYIVCIDYAVSFLGKFGFSHDSDCTLPFITKSENVPDCPTSLDISPSSEDYPKFINYLLNYVDSSSMYQIAVGFLYGLSQLGYGKKAIVKQDDISWYTGKYPSLLSSSQYYFDLIPSLKMDVGSNIFVSNTVMSDLVDLHLLSSNVDASLVHDLTVDRYSISGGDFISRSDFINYCSISNSYPVPLYIN